MNKATAIIYDECVKMTKKQLKELDKMTKKTTKQTKKQKFTTIKITKAMHTRIIANKNHYEKKNSVKLTIAEYMDMQDKESRVDEMTSMHYQGECNRLSANFGRLIDDFKSLQEVSRNQSDEIVRLNAMIIRKGKK